MRKGIGVCILVLVQVASAQGVDPEREAEAMLTVRAQARQVLDANEVLDGLEKLSRYPEAARVLLSQNQDPALLQALRAMIRPAAPSVVKSGTPKPEVRKPAVAPRQPAAKRSPALRVVGAWSAPKPKAIFLGDRYHIVYVGESFTSGAQSYTLRSILQLPSREEDGDRRYRVEYADNKGAVTRLVWPSS